MRCGMLGLLLCSLCGNAGAAQWRPIVSPDGQLFPALILATAAMTEPATHAAAVLGDPGGLVGARVLATRDGQPVRLVVRIPGLARESILATKLPRAGQRYELYPTVSWDYAALRALRLPGPATIEFELALDAAPAESESRRVQVRSLNDAPYFAAGGRGDVDLSWIFAAYVNEDHPLVDTILAEALASGIVDRFDGYSGNAEQVYRQAFAIWHVLRQRGIRYSSITRSSGTQARVLSQHVRFLDESWRNTQANCVDGSVLIASALRRIGIEPTLVVLPGHMLLGFDLDRTGKSRAYLETTLLGDDSPAATRPDHEASAEEREEVSFDSFEAAIERGFAQYLRAEARLADPREGEYVLVPIAEARRLGVAPIAPN